MNGSSKAVRFLNPHSLDYIIYPCAYMTPNRRGGPLCVWMWWKIVPGRKNRCYFLSVDAEILSIRHVRKTHHGQLIVTNMCIKCVHALTHNHRKKWRLPLSLKNSGLSAQTIELNSHRLISNARSVKFRAKMLSTIWQWNTQVHKLI
jgi:hypothetical protein